MASIIGSMLVPSGLAFVLFIVGLAAYLRTRWRRLSWYLLGLSGAITLVCSSGVVATALLSPLEYEYPALHDASEYPHVTRIVVLTGYAADDPDMPLTGRLHYASGFRVMMALELHQQCPACDVIVSGDAVTAKVMGEALVSLGLPEGRLLLETASENTAASAVNLKPLLQEPFFLITSAGHMRRSMAVLQTQGLEPIPVPTDYQGPKDWRDAELRPSPQSLFAADLAVHEYIGMVWYRMKGVI